MTADQAAPAPPRSDAQRRAIARSRQERAARRAELVAAVDQAIGEAGWQQARPLVVAVLGSTVPISGPRGRWRRLLRARTGRRLLDQLAALPAQPSLFPPARRNQPECDIAPGRSVTHTEIAR